MFSSPFELNSQTFSLSHFSLRHLSNSLGDGQSWKANKAQVSNKKMAYIHQAQAAIPALSLPQVNLTTMSPKDFTSCLCRKVPATVPGEL
ncbi:hypothetical protein O6P43_027498 [Quillaja saponaria]|uniref:Uncharacterized protein n=1 Tax=Quillaja saponaria TaxID=32244 RepID=A0AAD7L4I7_QUISA|nr:hypothetical protein O6P43_027498 [Quillaja saponaria]